MLEFCLNGVSFMKDCLDVRLSEFKNVVYATVSTDALFRIYSIGDDYAVSFETEKKIFHLITQRGETKLYASLDSCINEIRRMDAEEFVIEVCLVV